MARQTYTITDSDYDDAWNYCNGKLTDMEWPSTEKHSKAYKQFHALPDNDASALNAWCEQYLDRVQWTNLKNAIRSRRKRSNRQSEVKNVSLSVEAWERLKRVSDDAGLVMSDVILKYLKK